MLRSNKNEGIVLVAAIIVTLIVSLVAVAIASTAVSNRHLSISSYDSVSSYINAQAGLNLGEAVLLTSSGEELKNYTADFDSTNSVAIIKRISTKCGTTSTLGGQTDISKIAANDCFWWLGNVLGDPTYGSESFLSNVKPDSGSYYTSSNALTRFKLELRPESRTISLDAGDNLGRNFYRVTSIGKANGEGLSKLQGQIGVFTEVDKTFEIDTQDPDDDDCVGECDIAQFN
jgi:Tfp pilus assembly protein PilX